ncbi:fused response regulator/phosphatase [Leptospira biflexa]|jgi:serine phosphatase RsbU (regulator of sigma subunit)|uniref:Putative two-component regulator n=1 Tax=Leptospira biflexa serovar Patoc (strain Patoc 1 / ATCC 23582 / Paris) TaxID=456481 RepID=B0SSD9_LEPBP|nr:fused response regulator/phosphatase [Leptospira biflexa]ABZ94377.1 Serine phosphatase, regulator of sigma subunit [Leptospira biflexa serovar Patoc strain 'Patoc 1 (Ames)']ABZ98029.1 Putative two-component regulator [Leptospira biflexa serovar Patoc strain 'Patoc 1 (Paris)']TGM36699.1 fused response regulator/phosphatase [Leptospira biflexa]TGM39683.1 fused response regulator/phosphatase [Leptospira biflexa]TGM45160.1 fused response regulator/phosphatase [Leptospira biflexa]
MEPKDSQHTILIVDDVPENVELLKYLLLQEGFKTYTAYSAEEARLVLLNTSIDTLLLDVNMPEQDGFSFCRELRTMDQFKLLPILFITSIDREVGFQEAMKNGGDDFINKPFNKRELVAKIHSVIRLKDLQDELYQQKSKYEKELQTARRVQDQLIPEKSFIWNGIKAQTLFHPYLQIGGDFVDTWIEEKKLHIVIADCSGHGPSAALIGAMFKMQLFNLVANMGLKERVSHLRKNMELVLPEDYAITFCYAIIDPDLNLSYINGGHPAPIIYLDGETKLLKGMSPMIMGINMITNDEVQSVSLKQGSKFFMYTDGASEAMNANMEYITEEGMRDIFHESVVSGGDILPTVQNKILEFCGVSTPSDDMAMVCIQL